MSVTDDSDNSNQVEAVSAKGALPSKGQGAIRLPSLSAYSANPGCARHQRSMVRRLCGNRFPVQWTALAKEDAQEEGG